ncbi:O-antigen ligase family protein [Nitrospira sp. NS4]|uniref:O-antigen ligase family protein n=1 Tax=Nitrospira sp. NS4 TaxID=3414498 RepID=UPI003C2C3690
MLYYGLLLFFLLEYVRPTSYVPALSALHLNSIVPLTVFAGSMLSNGTVKTIEVLRSANTRWLMFFLVLFVVSGLTCDVKLYVYNTFMVVIGYVLIYFVIKKEVYDLDRMKGVFATLILIHVIVAALTPEMFSGDGQRHYIASGSFLGDGNDFALSVVIVIPLCLFLMLESTAKMKKLVYAGILVALVLAVVVTQSRGGVIALACVGLYYWLKSDKKMIGAVGIVAIVVVAVAFAPTELSQRMGTLTGEQLDGSAQGRLLAWGSAIRMAADNPILGVGVGHFPVKFGVEYRPAGVGTDEMPWLTAHSSYFLILGELGLPGIIFFVGLIVTNFRSGERMLRAMKMHSAERLATNRRLMIALNASLVGFAVGGAFLSAVYYPHIYFLAALLECGREICRKSTGLEVVAQGSGEEAPLAYRGVAI